MVFIDTEYNLEIYKFKQPVLLTENAKQRYSGQRPSYCQSYNFSASSMGLFPCLTLLLELATFNGLIRQPFSTQQSFSTQNTVS